MKIVLTGASGLLGQDLWRALSLEHQVFAMGRSRPEEIPRERWTNLDITSAPQTYQIITRVNPDCVLHAAAATNVDWCEANREEALRINALGTRNVALACQRFDAVLVYFSTNHVFGSGRPPKEGYREFDPTGPVNAYGHSKLWGETFVRELLSKFFIVRTSVLFGAGRENTVSRMIEARQSGKIFRAASDWICAPTYTQDLAAATMSLIETGLYGTYHVTNGSSCSFYELGREVDRCLGGKGTWLKKASLSGLALAAPRSPCAVLANTNWTLSGFTPLRPWKEALKDYLKKEAAAGIKAAGGIPRAKHA